MKKTLLLALMVALGSASMTAQAQESANEAREVNDIIGCVDTEALAGLKDADNTQVAHFLIQACPELDETDIDKVVAALDFIKSVVTGQLDKAIALLQQHRDWIVSVIDTVKVYLQKDVPLYLYLINNRVTPEMADVRDYTVDTVWAAPVDEMYYGLGDERNTYKPYGFSVVEQEAAKAKGARVKHNQSYLWGMVTVGDKVLWCTNTNYLCVGGTSGLGTGSEPGSDVSQGYANNCWVCEFESGIYGKTVHAKVDPSYSQYSDTRIPRIYSYNTKTGIVLDITPSGGEYDMLLQDCQGLRSAGAYNGVAFFGGPSLYGSTPGTTVGSSFFAYDTDAEKFIGCSNMSNVLDADGVAHTVTDIRRWMVYDGVLYAGVLINDSEDKATTNDRGAIIRWYGDKSDPWNFKIVGWTKHEAAELCVYNGKLYVGTWDTNHADASSVDKGPEMPAGGLQPVGSNESNFETVWKYSDYDKNRVSVSSSYTAGLKVWKGKLYWGMFCASYAIPTTAASLGYTDFTSPEAIAFILGTLRQTSFWRIDEDDNVELLYGESKLPKWGRTSYPYTDTWSFEETGFTPKFGRAGYGQLFTAYTWTMEEYHNDLYCGTMNMENLIGAVADNGNATAGSFYKALELLCGISEKNYGFELLRWQDPDVAPEYITTNGFGNGSAYGIRNFTIQGDDLYVGSASPLNLATYGGCHLFKMNDGTQESIDGGSETAITNTKKDAGIYVRRNGGNLNIATVNGESLTDVTVYDLSGRTVASSKATSNAATLSVPEGAVIINVTSEKGNWQGKIQ